jgi:hypothetical protein
MTELVINYESMKKIVLEDNSLTLHVPQLKFIRNKTDWSMRTEIREKKMRYTFDKRIVLDNYETLPYGF